MPNIQLVATDIDGTLADDQRQLSPYTLETLRALLGRDVPVVLVTGLNPWPARRYADQIGHGVRAICLNGIFLLEDGELHEGEYIDEATAREAVDVIVERGYVPLVYGADGVSRYLPQTGEAMDEVSRLFAERPYQPYVAVADAEALFAVRPAQVSVCDSEVRGAALHPELDETVGSKAYVVHQPGPRTWVEVNHSDARKDVALLALADRLGAEPASIVYFGDSLNDLVVFRALPHAVAVANARPEVKALAWRETASNNDGGVARFLAEMFNL